MGKWFDITNKAGAGSIAIYDEIGAFGISAGAFHKELQALGSVARIDLSINSPGGSVFDGLAIYNMLKRHKAKVYVTIDGVAASIASVIAMAGDHITMPANAFLMVHSAAGFAEGNAEDIRKMADDLEKINKSMVGIYSARTGIPAAEIEDIMTAGYWISAAVAVERGFADKVLPEKRMAAKYDLKAKLPNAPAALLNYSALPATSSWDRVIERLNARIPGGVAG